MSDEKRTYTKRKRAEHEAATRLRITESAVALHGTVGPSRASISAIADHAGVRRSTVYRHFPDEASLFEACSSHWAAANPLPDPAGWPDLEAALSDLYAFYAANEQMLDNLLRDEAVVPSVAQQFANFRGYLEMVRDAVGPGDPATGHALSFRTWQSLVREQGLSQDEAVRLMCRLCRG